MNSKLTDMAAGTVLAEGAQIGLAGATSTPIHEIVDSIKACRWW